MAEFSAVASFVISSKLIDLDCTNSPYLTMQTMTKRLFVPTLGDVLLLVIVFWLFFANPESWSSFMGDANTGLHIRTGDAVLATGHVPTTDLYSYSKPGGTWFAFEWLT